MPGRGYVEGGTDEERAEEDFTGYEKDEATGLHYAGARYYSAAFGRFTTTDRYADKYPSRSPYQYAANNPVLVVDVNGDSTYVENEEDREGGILASIANFFGFGKTVTYVKRSDGFYNTNTGEKASPENGSFLSEAVKGIKKLRSTKSGKKAIDAFTNSEKNHITIKEGDNEYKSPSKSPGTYHATIYWNPDDRTVNAPDVTGSTQRPPFVGLGHEVAHAYDGFGYDGDMGMNPNNWLDNSGNPVVRNSTGNPVKKSEMYASWVENKIRMQSGVPRRLSYDPNGRLIIPTTKPQWINF